VFVESIHEVAMPLEDKRGLKGLRIIQGAEHCSYAELFNISSHNRRHQQESAILSHFVHKKSSASSGVRSTWSQSKLATTDEDTPAIRRGVA